MKSLYKLLFICILAVTAVSAGNFALYRINEQQQEVIEALHKRNNPQPYIDYTPLPQSTGSNLRVYDRTSPGLRKAIDEMEKQFYGE